MNPWHPDAIPPIDPNDPRIGHATGEFGPEDYIDTGYPSTAKYPAFKSKRKNTKKQSESTKKKKLDFSKKGMIQTTLDRWLSKPRTPTRVRFKERVLLKEITTHMESWTRGPLKGFSDPYSAFALKRPQIKRTMARQHRKNRDRPTAKNARRVIHILKRMLQENTKLGY